MATIDAGTHVNEDGAPEAPPSTGDPWDASGPDQPFAIDAAEQEDMGERPDVSLDLVSAPLPAAVGPPRLMVAGPARLIGDALRACTNQVPPSGNGDRWCGFKRPAAGGSGTELWVINATRASTTTIPCDGTSPDCVRLTSALWVDEPLGGPYQEEATRFEGDTLIFHADAASAPDQPFTGPIFVWRPGWTNARRIATQGYSCFAHESLPLAFCNDAVAYQGKAAVELDVLVGSVADPAGGVLPKLDHVFLRRADGEVSFGGRFSNAGDYFLYSAPASASSPTAGLRVAKVTAAGVGTPNEILSDVLNWEISHDDTKVFFFRDFKGEVGRLTVADFPSGANPRLISSQSNRYVVLGSGKVDQGVGFFVDPGGRFFSEYRAVPDLAKPLDSVVVFRYRPPLEDFHRSGDGRFTGYAKSDDRGFNAFIAHTDGSGECVINSELDRPGFEYAFLADSSMVFWEEQSLVDSAGKDGWLADPEGCKGKQRFAAKLLYYNPVRSAGLIYGDESDDVTVSLKYAILEDGRWPRGGPVRVRDGVDLPVSILLPGEDRIVFQVSTGPPEQVGLYVFGPIPFPSP